ncbi:MAG: hypothetical protein ACRDZW_06235 [Acidimicrobiales bacterium]
MLLWFAGLSVIVVWQVFRDTAIDYRLVMAGALAADVVDAAFGGVGPLHTLVGSAILLTAVMLATRGRRGLRRWLLALPIGTFLHLALDAMWTRTTVFWWPLFGRSFGDDGVGLPSLARSPALVAVQELAGAVALVWFFRRFDLADPQRRRHFLQTGRLDRELGRPSPRVSDP